MKLDLGAAMPAMPLVIKGGDKVVAWACGSCHAVAHSCTEQGALECCAPKLCDCGEPVEKHRTACRTCIARHEAEAEAARLAKAKGVPESGWLYCGCCDEFFESSADLLERHDEDGRDLPTTATPCYPRQLSLDASDIVNQAAEEFHEGAVEDADLEALQTALDDWNNKSGVISHFPEFTEVVDLSEARAAFLAEQARVLL